MGCFNRDINDISYFIKLIDHIIYKDKLTPNEFAQFTFDYMKGELKENEYFNTTCSIDN